MMDSNSEKIIEAYISKLFEVQRARENQPLTEQALKEIALDAGMSEENWQAAQEVYQDHVERAEGFLKYKNWSDAIQEYKQALRIKPNNTQALSSIAYAYKMRWHDKSQSEDRTHALVFARRCLQSSPENAQSLIIVSELSKEENFTKKPQIKAKQTIFMAIAAGIISLLVAVFFWQTGNIAEDDFDEKDYTTSPKTATNAFDDLPQGIKVALDGNANITIEELSSEFKKLFGNRTSHHATCSFQNTGNQTIKRLKVEVTWFDQQGNRIIQRDFNVVPEDGAPIAAGQTKAYVVKQSFPQGKTRDDFRYYVIKIRKIQTQ